MLEEFVRPDLDETEKTRVPKWVNIIVCSKGRQVAIATMTALIVENIRLTKEVNLHLEKLGYEKLPVYEPNL
jgi:hypothetical protein